MFTLPDRSYKTKTRVQGTRTCGEGEERLTDQNWGPGTSQMHKLRRTPLSTGAAQDQVSAEMAGLARDGGVREGLSQQVLPHPCREGPRKPLLPAVGAAVPVGFLSKGKAAAISGSVCISTDRNCGLPSMFPGERSGSKCLCVPRTEWLHSCPG